MRLSASTKARTTIVFGHADGDGYLAAEVTRGNLVAEGWTVTDVVVDPQKTRNCKFWQGYFQDWDFSSVDLVVTVDLAFDFTEPGRSCKALSRQASEFPDTRFLVIDHHPLKADTWLPDNVSLREAASVFACCYGDPNDLMVIASICDNDEAPVKELITPAHRVLAEGIRRAASDFHGVAGSTLRAMLENQQWAWFFALGSEPKGLHRRFYGVRTRSSPVSPTLNSLPRG